MLSTRNVILLVARALILETSIGRCASGNDVLGAAVELVRFVVADGAVVAVDEVEAAAVGVVPEVAMRRSGRNGIANVGDTADEVSFKVFWIFPWGAEINVNGSIGYGVSETIFRTNVAYWDHKYPPLNSWIL